MPVPPDISVLCPVLIGRDPYRAALARGVERARAGQGQVFLLAGEAGIGKSRLLAEAKEIAAQEKFSMMQGSCFEPDWLLPYGPMLDLLRSFIAGRPASGAADALRPYAPELIKLIPELNLLLPEAQAAPALEPEPEKRRRFEVLAQFLLAGPDPVLVAVEDLHWCDDTSLEFLLHFARRAVSRPVLFVLTYRSDHAQQHPPLQHFLAELERARLGIELPLSRLPSEGVEGMINAIFAQDRPARREFVDAIHALTEGNPFFVEEVLKSLVAEGDIYLSTGVWTRKPLDELHIPRTVQDAVERRTRQLGEAARRLLTLAAVAGRRFDLAQIQRLAGLPEPELVPAVRALVDAQLVVEESANQFAFRHALTRQAIYAGLIGRERQALHQSLAEALEQNPPDGPDGALADLAYHFFEAGQWERAYEYARRAGEQAQAGLAPRAAAAHFGRALEAARHLPSPPARAELEAVQAARGRAYQVLGDFQRAREDFHAALHGARARGDQRAEWQARLDLGFAWVSRDYTRAGEHFQQALKLAQGLSDPAALAQSLNRVGNWHLNADQPHAGLRYHQEALQIFETLGDRAGQAATLDLMGIALFTAGDTLQGAAHYERAAGLWRVLDDRSGLASSLAILAPRHRVYVSNASVWPDVPLAEREAAGEAALRLMREIGSRPGESIAQIWLGLGLATAGEYGRGLELMQAGLALAEEVEHRHNRATGHMALGCVYWDILAPALARRHLEQALALARESGSLVWLGAIQGFLASAMIQQGELGLAQEVLEAACPPELPMQTMGQRQVWCAWAEWALAQGDTKPALEVTDRLIETAPNSAGRGEHAIPRLALLRAEALAALGMKRQAQAVLQAAIEGAAVDRPWLWRLWASLARLHRSQRWRDPAEEAAAEARAIIEDLAGRIPDPDLRGGFTTAALGRLPRLSAAASRRRVKAKFGGLTPREREVAALIAQGKSNRAIAGDLVLSERTVAKHVENILSKLGFESRAQVAAWAASQRLPGSTPASGA